MHGEQNAVAQTLFGGFTPFMCVWLIDVTGNPMQSSRRPPAFDGAI